MCVPAILFILRHHLLSLVCVPWLNCYNIVFKTFCNGRKMELFCLFSEPPVGRHQRTATDKNKTVL